MATIDVLLVEPLKRPRMVTIPQELSAMQNLVSGPITATYPWEDEVALVCCDDAIALGYEPNRMISPGRVIFGTFFIAGLGAEEFISLSPELQEKFRLEFVHPDWFVRGDDGRLVCFRWAKEM